MACSGCARRREAMKAFAINLTKSVKQTVAGLSSAERSAKTAAPQKTPTHNLPCTNCAATVTKEGWINSCTICGAVSAAKPIPHKLPPNCECNK